jgi:alpha-beta hydrolase superfamily lysophospholipase
MKKILPRFILSFYVVIVFINILAAIHAWRFTHYDTHTSETPRQPQDLNFKEKLKALLFGVAIPRPEEMIEPHEPYSTHYIGKKLEAWYIPAKNARATVILFHGYGSNKSSVYGKASIFHQMGYHTLMVDFRGSGGSAGNTTSIGFHEAEDVTLAYEYVKKMNAQPIILCGTSMGAAAVMKFMQDQQADVRGIILECPFGTMYQTVANRFEAMHLPEFPLADLLLFYGSVWNNFWAFDHNPEDYARNIDVPVLLLCGTADERVKPQETLNIFEGFKGPKKLVWFKGAGHESYLNHHRKEWKQAVQSFLKQKEIQSQDHSKRH